jgi:hypothetical protein
MGFWSFSQAAAPQVQPPVASDVFEPVQVFTRFERIRGEIDPNGRRMTDLLNAQPALSVRLENGVWKLVDRDEILVVAPPPYKSNPQMRVHRRKRRVLARVGPYDVIGTAHTIPGIDLEPTLLRTRQHFLAITGAYIRDAREPDFEQDLAVAIVHVGNTTDLEALDILS